MKNMSTIPEAVTEFLQNLWKKASSKKQKLI